MEHENNDNAKINKCIRMEPRLCHGLAARAKNEGRTLSETIGRILVGKDKPLEIGAGR